MSTIIKGQLNTQVGANWLRSEFAAAARPFLAVSIPQNSYGIDVSGLSFGLDYVLADFTQSPSPLFVSYVALLVESLIPVPEVDILDQLGLPQSLPPVSSSRQRIRHLRFMRGGFTDKDDDFATPIKIPSGTSFSAILFATTLPIADPGTAIASAWMTVRGRILDRSESDLLR